MLFREISLKREEQNNRSDHALVMEFYIIINLKPFTAFLFSYYLGLAWAGARLGLA